MYNNFIQSDDPRVSDLLRRLEKVSKELDKIELSQRRALNGARFITDSELSSLLRVTRRTLQEYRTGGIIPYYLICGKILYAESEIQQLLENARNRCLDEQRLV